MFILKKLIGTLLMPLPFSLMLLLLGLMLLWFSAQYSRKQVWAKWLISLGVGVLLISSLPQASLLLNRMLERENLPLLSMPSDLDYVIVLGGGHISDPYLPPQEQLSSASYRRVMLGFRLMRANPGATLLLSGYGGSDPVSNARVASRTAQQYGISKERIQLFETARDTADEAALIAPVIVNHKSALVTSASHMPRALSLFHAQGVSPVAAPTVYLGKERQSTAYFYQQLPGADNLSEVTVAWHEIVGSLWRKISYGWRQDT